MEYILPKTDIFDPEISTKFSEAIQHDRVSYDKDKVYKLTASFHANLLADKRWMEFTTPEPPYRKIEKKESTTKDKIHDVMSFQLENLKQILTDNGIVADYCTIQGDHLDKEHIIKIEIKEDTREPIYETYRKKKRKVRVICNSIVPNLPELREGASKMFNEIMVKHILDEIYKEQKEKNLINNDLNLEDKCDNED